MDDDAQCLRRYAEHGSEEAFRELVDRHLPMVYSTAIRILGGDAQLAEDVAQRVFSDVARKARTLAHQAVLAGWLHRHTTFTASKTVRSERRRQTREQEAVRMNTESGPESSKDHWEQVEPQLDRALDALGRSDRDAVVLRFLQRRDLRSVGQALGCSEDAAQKRVSRAIDKLRRYLERRGVTLSAAALATTLTSHATGAAPLGLASVISSGALTSVAAAGASLAGAGVTSTLIQFMTTEKLTTVAVSTLLVAGLGTPLALQYGANKKLEEENLALHQQIEVVDQLRAENELMAASRIDPDELERLRRDNAELHRLRGEVALLRSQQQDADRLKAENAELRQTSATMLQSTADEVAASLLKEQEFKTNIDRLNLPKYWMLAIHLYAQENEGMVPAEAVAALAFVPSEVDAIEGLTADDLEVVYAGRLDEIQDPARTIVLREREPRISLDGKWTRAYGFADGHSELRAESEGDFTAWEQERMVGTITQ
jgi:RNA polymerase sigma factor (sigma-70 family)